MKRGTLFFTLVLMLFVSIGQLQAGNIYKWTDAKGNVHYGERPPDKGATKVRIRARGGVEASDTPAPPASRHNPNIQRDKMIRALEGDRLARQEKRQKLKQQQKKRQSQCAQAKDVLRRYRQSSSIYTLDEKGDRRTLSQSARQAEIDRLQANIKQRCK